jgi:hypothetical protein
LYDPNNRNLNNNGTNTTDQVQNPITENSNNGLRNSAKEQTAPTRIDTNSGGTRDNSIQNRDLTIVRVQMFKKKTRK